MTWIKELFTRRRIYDDLGEEIQQHLLGTGDLQYRPIRSPAPHEAKALSTLSLRTEVVRFRHCGS